MTISKTSKEFQELSKDIKQYIADMGQCSISEFKTIVEPHDVDHSVLLASLQESGIVYAKSSLGYEVLVDIRLMVAGMLVAYSHAKYAKTNLVLDYLKHVFDLSTPPGRNYISHKSLMCEAYTQLGHNYTISKVAERSVIDFVNSEPAAYDLFERSQAELTVLARNDADLTAVYRMAKHAFDVANGWSPGSVYGMRRKELEVNSTFNHFHRLAATMVNKFKPKNK